MSETSASGAKESKTKDNTSFETTRDKSDKSIAKEATVLPPVVPKFAATQQQTTKFKRLTELRQQDRKKLITNQLKLKVESLDADEEQQLKSNLKTKVIAIAIAVGILPLLAVGTTWYLGNLSLDRATETREGEALKTVNIPRLQAEELIILIGTGAAAILAGALAAFWASRTIYSASLAAATATAEKYRQERGERTQLFTEAIYRIRASLNQEDILRATVEEARLAIGADRVLVYSLDEQSRGMMIAESVDPKFPRALGALIDDPCFSATYMEKYQNGRVQAVDNIDEANLTPCHLQQLEPFAVKANLVVPLMNEGKLIGLLIAHHCSGPHAWQQAEIDLFVQLATQAGFALDNAKLLAESANLQQRVEAEIKWKGYLKDATKHLYESLDEEEILKAGVEEARRVLECDRVVVYSVDRQSQGVIIAESVAAGWPRILGRKIEDPCFEAKYIQKYENGRVRAINNIYEAGMTQCYIAQLETIAVKANLVAPVVREGKLLGLLVAHQCSEARVWQQLEIKWLEQLALQLGFALDNATLVGRVSQISQEAEAEAQKHRQEQQAVIKWKEYLKDATQHLYESLEEEEILKASVEEARRVLECDRVVVYSVDRKSQGIIISESVAPGWPRVLGRKIEDPCFEAKYIQKYENGRVRAIDNIYEAGMSQCYIEQLETIAVKANLVAPVVKEGKLLGLLVAHQCSEARVWQQLEINWLEQLAIQLGFALDNATLVGRVAQISQEAEAEAQKHRQEQQALQHQIVKLIKDSQAALKSFESKTLRQSDSVMSVLEGIQAVADSARSLAGSTQQIELQLQQTSKTVEAGYESANRTVDDISRIQETLIEAVEKVKHLSESSQQISQAMSLIKDLAAQMNQQALNTTIEAGRKADVAQESVVSLAETVRFSTQQLTAATAEVEPLIRTMQTEANELVAVMEAKTEKASGETDSIEETRQKLNQIAAISAKMSGLVNKIAHAAAQQTQTSAAARKSILEAASLASKTSEASAVVTESWQKLAAVVQDI